MSEQTKTTAHLGTDDTKENENKSTKDAECAKKVVDVIKSRMINPFTCEEDELLNISTGYKVASESLVSAREKGLEALAAVRKASCNTAAVKLATFASESKKSISKAPKEKSVYEEESAF